MLARGRDGLELSRLRARLFDEALEAHFNDACGRVGVAVERAPVVLAAAGSYGRGAMALESDVDVRLIVTGLGDARSLADAFLYPLWDAGLSIGHQLAVPSELLTLAETDMATATTLFDLRTVAGAPKRVRDLVAKFVTRMRRRARAFARELADDTKKRHERYGDSIYLLEPDSKLGAGGLRDLDVARWVLRCRAHAPDDPLETLVTRGALDARELDAARAAEEFAWRVRNRLHALAGRRSDRLTFDAQESLARDLGYVRGEGEDARAEATERFMQDHYVHARAISRVRDRAISVVTRVPSRKKVHARDLGGGLAFSSGVVSIADPARIMADPAISLRAYAACARLGAPLDDASRDAIMRVAAEPEFGAGLRASRESGAAFVDLTCMVAETPAALGTALRDLHDVGLLLAMIPEFLPVTGRVHHDVYHVLTVDVHSVAAVDCLRALARGELATAHPLASRLATEIARPRPLFLATLLHDVGKGHPDRDGSRKNHSVSGAELCDVVLPRLGFTASETADARALVLNHLAMYHLAARRDLDDPATIDELCRIVRGREGLRDLYLLTVADITTTAPRAMTSWKAHVLEELYLRADDKLAGAPTTIDAERIAAVGAEVLMHDADAGAFVSTMPPRYVLATRPESIAAHARIARSRGHRQVAVGLGPHPSAAHVEVCVVARDRPGLLARIAAALAASRLEVSAAFINTRGEGEAVDIFVVRDPGESIGQKLAQVETDLIELCEDRVAPGDLVASRLGESLPWATRKTPDVRTRVVFDDRTSPHSTIIEVFAKDEPGLLFRLAHALDAAGVSIVLSKINTEGTKVADVFYVQEVDGRKVAANRLAFIRERLLEAIR